MKAEYGMSIEVSPGNWKKMNLFLDAKDGETPHQLMDRVEEEVETWFAKRLPRGAERLDPSIIFNEITPREIIVDKTPEEERKRSLREDIMSCHDLENLESFKLLAKANPELQEAYEFMFKKLTLKD